MYQASDAFVSNLDTAKFIAKIVLPDGTVISGADCLPGRDPIQSIVITSGNAAGKAVAIGCAVSASAEIMLSKEFLQNMTVNSGEIIVSLGMEVNDGVEWIPMGHFNIIDVVTSDDLITLKCMDAIGTTLEHSYEAIQGFEFSPGVSAKAFLAALCVRRGISLDTEDLPDVLLEITEPEGYTERQIIAAVAGLWGRFACMDRNGTLRFFWYSEADFCITPDNYYEGECERGTLYSLSYLKCYNSTLEETLIAGNADGKQGVYFSCPWCSQEQLEAVFLELENFSYNPVPFIRLLGNPLLDPWDIVAAETLDGDRLTLPVLMMSHEYDGGISTTIQAPGELTGDGYVGPVEREFRRTTAKIVKRMDEIVLQVETLEGEAEGTKTAIGALSIRSDSIAASVLQTERTVEATNESVAELTAEVASKMSPEAVDLHIRSALESGAGKVITETGFTFDETGLTIQKVGTAMKTQITEDGMTVYKNASAVLEADHQGVKAVDLYAKTYLRIGQNSRLEDYGNSRTACFWIGG